MILRRDWTLLNVSCNTNFKWQNYENIYDAQIENYIFAVERSDGKIMKKYITIVKCKYDSEIGMSDEYEETIDDSNIL